MPKSKNFFLALTLAIAIIPVAFAQSENNQRAVTVLRGGPSGTLSGYFSPGVSHWRRRDISDPNNPDCNGVPLNLPYDQNTHLAQAEWQPSGSKWIYGMGRLTDSCYNNDAEVHVGRQLIGINPMTYKDRDVVHLTGGLFAALIGGYKEGQQPLAIPVGGGNTVALGFGGYTELSVPINRRISAAVRLDATPDWWDVQYGVKMQFGAQGGALPTAHRAITLFR